MHEWLRTPGLEEIIKFVIFSSYSFKPQQEMGLINNIQGFHLRRDKPVINRLMQVI